MTPIEPSSTQDDELAPVVLDAAVARELRLVQRAREGDSQAWSDLYRLSFAALYRDVRFFVADAATAEELTQESFAVALTSLDRFRAEASFRGWIRGIAYNLARRRWRSEERRGRAYDRLEASFRSSGDAAQRGPEDAILQKSRAAALSAVLRTVNPALREVFVLRDVQGLPVEEVAARLGITSGNVRVRANRAREKIRTELEALGWIERREAR